MASTPEGRVKKLIKKYLDSLGEALCWYHMPVQTQYGRRTIDFHVCYRGRFLAIEAKAPGKEPTAAQWRDLRLIEYTGGAAFWVDGPERLQLVKDWVELVDMETGSFH